MNLNNLKKRNLFTMKSITYNFKTFLTFLLLVCGMSSLYAQTITIGTLSRSEYCSGSSITIPFTVTGVSSEFEVKVQLSSASGSFNGSSNYISDRGFSSNTVTGQITATIPSSTATGYSYRVRLVCKINSLTILSQMNSIPLVIGRQVANSKPVPSFTLPTSMCSGTQFVLPTKSSLGVSGTWSPVFNNTVTTNTNTTYTFTPTLSCFSTVAKTISVNANITPTFNAVEAVCSGNTMSALPTQSTNNVSGTWSPALNNTQTTTYTFTPAAGLCALTKTMTVVVNPRTTPSFDELTPICAGASITNLPQTSLNGISGSWSPVLNNNQTTTYTFTPNTNFCSVSTTTTQIVSPVLTPIFTQISPICSGADLILPTTSENGISGLWSPELNNYSTTTYTFTPSTGICANSTEMTVVVNPIITPTFEQVSSICDGGSFTLPSTSENGVIGTWSPALNNTATTTYTFTPAIGFCANTNQTTVVVNPIITPLFSELTPICAGASITNLPQTSLNGISGSWSPVLNNNQTTTYTFTPNTNFCSVSTTTTQIVSPVLTPIFTQISPICSGADLILPTTSENGISGLWSPELNNYSTTTYTFTPSTGICANSTEMTVVVNPIITPTFEQVSSICDGGSFTLPSTSENGIIGTWSPALDNTATTTYTFTPSIGLCASTSTMTVDVNPIITPTFNEVSSICFGESVSDFAETSTNGISGSWSPSEINNHHTTTYTFTPNNDFCATSIIDTLVVNPIITADTTVISCLSYTWPANGQTYTESGAYTYVSGCTTRTLNLTITQPAVLGAPSIINGTASGLCLSGITNPTFSVSSVTGATSYEWTVPTGATIVSGQGTNSVTLNITGDFTIGNLSVKALNVCTTSVVRTTTIRGILATPGTITGTLTGLCVSGTTNPTYLAATVAGATGYTWTSPTGTTITNGQGTASMSLAVSSSFTSGNVTVTADNACGSSIPKTLAITSVTLMPGVILGTTVGLGINGITTATYTTTNVVGAIDYLWTIPAGTTVVSGQGTNTITLNFTSSFTSGTLTVVARTACGSSPGRTLSLYSAPLTPGNITGTTTGLCSQATSTATYSIAPVLGATHYMWTAPAGATIVSGQGTTSIVLSFSGTFTTGALSVCACNLCGSSTVKTLTLNSVPAIPGAVTGLTNNLCPSGLSNPTYSIAAVAGATSYTWTAPSGMTISSGQGTTSVALNVSESFVSGALTLVANNACGSSLVKSVTLTSTPLTPASITGSAAPCGTTTYTCAAVSQAVSYTWTVPAGLEIVSGQGTNSITVNVISSTVSGSITVKASNNCKTGAAKSMVVSSCTAKSMLTSTEETVRNNYTSKIDAVVYPNPTNSEVNIEFASELENDVKVELYDMIGNKVSRFGMSAGSTVGNLTLEGMTSGMYLLQVVNSSNDIIYKAKVSKQ